MKKLAFWIVVAILVIWLVQYPTSAAHIFASLASGLNHALAAVSRFAYRL